jgi:RNA polymerase sigma factor (sigma-70 family)
MDVKNINGEFLTLEQCLEEHKATVHKFARKFRFSGKRNGLEYEDLVSVGFEGLIKAYQKFNPEYNIRFSTFSFVAVERSIKREIQQSYVGAKVPREIKNISSVIIARKLEDKSIQEIALAVETTLEKAERALDYVKNSKPLYLGATVRESKDITYLDSLMMEDDSSSIYIKEFMSLLNPKELYIVEHLIQEKTQSEIGELLSVSQQHVGRLIKKIKEKYRTFQTELVG